MREDLRRLVKGYGLRYTLVAGAVLTAASTACATVYLGIDPRNALFFQGFVAAGLVLVPFATSDVGIESAGSSVAGGFDVTNPSDHRTDTDGPFRVKVAFVLAGILLYSVLGFLGLGLL